MSEMRSDVITVTYPIVILTGICMLTLIELSLRSDYFDGPFLGSIPFVMMPGLLIYCSISVINSDRIVRRLHSNQKEQVEPPVDPFMSLMRDVFRRD